jgi:hypothetical protein
MALILSCFAKPCLILTMIWDNHRDHFVNLFTILVTTSNIVGVKGTYTKEKINSSLVFMESSTLEATGVVLCGNVVRWMFQLLVYALIDSSMPIGISMF